MTLSHPMSNPKQTQTWISPLRLWTKILSSLGPAVLTAKPRAGGPWLRASTADLKSPPPLSGAQGKRGHSWPRQLSCGAVTLKGLAPITYDVTFWPDGKGPSQPGISDLSLGPPEASTTLLLVSQAANICCSFLRKKKNLTSILNHHKVPLWSVAPAAQPAQGES